MCVRQFNVHYVTDAYVSIVGAIILVGMVSWIMFMVVGTIESGVYRVTTGHSI